MKTAEFANHVDPDEVAHYEPPHLDLHCLVWSLHSQYDIAWTKLFSKFLQTSFLLSAFWSFKGLSTTTAEAVKQTVESFVVPDSIHSQNRA